MLLMKSTAQPPDYPISSTKGFVFLPNTQTVNLRFTVGVSPFLLYAERSATFLLLLPSLS